MTTLEMGYGQEVKKRTKELMTSLISGAFQRRELILPADDSDIEDEFTTHTYTLNDGRTVYSKGKDHFIDAVRCAVLARQQSAVKPMRMFRHTRFDDRTGKPEGDWDRVSGEFMTFDDPVERPRALDRLKGFRPGDENSLFIRVIFPVRIEETAAWCFAWGYSFNEKRLKGLRKRRITSLRDD